MAYYSEQPDGLARSLKSYCLLGGPRRGGIDKDNRGSMVKNAATIVRGRGGGEAPAADNGGPAMEPKTALNIIDASEIVEGAVIGSGNFGDVKQGQWHKPGSPPIAVALKTLRDMNHSKNATEEFLLEATDMSRLHNPYIVQLLGITISKTVSIVLELVSFGALESLLRKMKISKYKEWVKEGTPYLMGAQICIAMDFLESKRVVHRDLATRNVLLKTPHHCKISDFGLSRTLRADENYYTSTEGGTWPIKWYAPESVSSVLLAAVGHSFHSLYSYPHPLLPTQTTHSDSLTHSLALTFTLWLYSHLDAAGELRQVHSEE